MEIIELFKDTNGKWLTNRDLLESLLKLEADKCDTLYIHSSLSFGVPNVNLKRFDILSEIYEVLQMLGVPTLCMPTYTFSYCNGCVYDPLNSKTKMGSLNEYFRKQPNVIRSHDPLMSVAVLGKDLELALDVSMHSIGDSSTFDLLHHRDNVKFLFLGTQIGECFTYMHYLEWLFGVEYRYERHFQGVSVLDGNKQKNEYDLFVRYNGVNPNNNTFKYEQGMYHAGVAYKETLGDSSISIVDEKTACSFYKKCLEGNPFYFVDIDSEPFFKDKTFVLEKEMVAL